MAESRMCPHCRAFIESRAKTCEYCGNPLPETAGRRIRRTERMERFSGETGFTTKILLLINLGFFAASWILSFRHTGEWDLLGGIDAEVLHIMGAKFRLSILFHDEWWRLITANFLHGGLLHLAFNSMSLWNLGPLAETVFGTSRYLVLYLLTGFAGFVASTFWSPSLSIGASASICGLIGALYGFGRVSFNSQLRSAALRWVIAIGVFGLLFPAIDNAAHIGGLAAGFAFSYLGGVPGTDASKESLWKGVAIGSVAVAVAAFGMAYLHFAERTT